MTRQALQVLLMLGMVSTCVWSAGCSAGAAGALAGMGAAAARVPPTPAQKLMLFGGLGHKTYLGCLNCSQYAVDSIRNEYGQNGSPYATDSIRNSYGQYGSPYSSHSACNEFAADPPVIVDGNGNFYGRLTVNEYHPQRSNDASLVQWLKREVCKQGE